MQSAYEIDHIYICCDVGAPEAESLIDFGLSEGAGNSHPGQGTANRRFFFSNFMLELIWITQADELKAQREAGLKLFDRFQNLTQGAAPFGVCLRPSTKGAPLPFNCSTYKPEYLPTHYAIALAKEQPLDEPDWFYLDFARRPDQKPTALQENMTHANGIKQLDHACLALVKQSDFSGAAQAVQNVTPGIDVSVAESHLLTLQFDGYRQGIQHDFRPGLPLLINY